MKNIGISGSRDGATEAQAIALKSIMVSMHVLYPDTVFHHGCCVGVDEMAHDIALKLNANLCLHPPKNERKMLNLCKFPRENSIINPPKEYLIRNRILVNSSSLLIAVPKTMTQKGGTWYTINYAKNNKIKTIIIKPDGSLRVC